MFNLTLLAQTILSTTSSNEEIQSFNDIIYSVKNEMILGAMLNGKSISNNEIAYGVSCDKLYKVTPVFKDNEFIFLHKFTQNNILFSTGLITQNVSTNSGVFWQNIQSNTNHNVLQPNSFTTIGNTIISYHRMNIMGKFYDTIFVYENQQYWIYTPFYTIAANNLNVSYKVKDTITTVLGKLLSFPSFIKVDWKENIAFVSIIQPISDKIDNNDSVNLYNGVYKNLSTTNAVVFSDNESPVLINQNTTVLLVDVFNLQFNFFDQNKIYFEMGNYKILICETSIFVMDKITGNMDIFFENNITSTGTPFIQFLLNGIQIDLYIIKKYINGWQISYKQNNVIISYANNVIDSIFENFKTVELENSINVNLDIIASIFLSEIPLDVQILCNLQVTNQINYKDFILKIYSGLENYEIIIPGINLFVLNRSFYFIYNRILYTIINNKLEKYLISYAEILGSENGVLKLYKSSLDNDDNFLNNVILKINNLTFNIQNMSFYINPLEKFSLKNGIIEDPITKVINIDDWELTIFYIKNTGKIIEWKNNDNDFTLLPSTTLTNFFSSVDFQSIEFPSGELIQCFSKNNTFFFKIENTSESIYIFNNYFVIIQNDLSSIQSGSGVFRTNMLTGEITTNSTNLNTDLISFDTQFTIKLDWENNLISNGMSEINSLFFAGLTFKLNPKTNTIFPLGFVTSDKTSSITNFFANQSMTNDTYLINDTTFVFYESINTFVIQTTIDDANVFLLEDYIVVQKASMIYVYNKSGESQEINLETMIEQDTTFFTEKNSIVSFLNSSYAFQFTNESTKILTKSSEINFNFNHNTFYSANSYDLPFTSIQIKQANGLFFFSDDLINTSFDNIDMNIFNNYTPFINNVLFCNNENIIYINAGVLYALIDNQLMTGSIRNNQVVFSNNNQNFTTKIQIGTSSNLITIQKTLYGFLLYNKNLNGKLLNIIDQNIQTTNNLSIGINDQISLYTFMETNIQFLAINNTSLLNGENYKDNLYIIGNDNNPYIYYHRDKLQTLFSDSEIFIEEKEIFKCTNQCVSLSINNGNIIETINTSLVGAVITNQYFHWIFNNCEIWNMEWIKESNTKSLNLKVQNKIYNLSNNAPNKEIKIFDYIEGGIVMEDGTLIKINKVQDNTKTIASWFINRDNFPITSYKTDKSFNRCIYTLDGFNNITKNLDQFIYFDESESNLVSFISKGSNLILNKNQTFYMFSFTDEDNIVIKSYDTNTTLMCEVKIQKENDNFNFGEFSHLINNNLQIQLNNNKKVLLGNSLYLLSPVDNYMFTDKVIHTETVLNSKVFADVMKSLFTHTDLNLFYYNSQLINFHMTDKKIPEVIVFSSFISNFSLSNLSVIPDSFLFAGDNNDFVGIYSLEQRAFEDNAQISQKILYIDNENEMVYFTINNSSFLIFNEILIGKNFTFNPVNRIITYNNQSYSLNFENNLNVPKTVLYTSNFLYDLNFNSDGINILVSKKQKDDFKYFNKKNIWMFCNGLTQWAVEKSLQLFPYITATCLLTSREIISSSLNFMQEIYSSSTSFFKTIPINNGSFIYTNFNCMNNFHFSLYNSTSSNLLFMKDNWFIVEKNLFLIEDNYLFYWNGNVCLQFSLNHSLSSSLDIDVNSTLSNKIYRNNQWIYIDSTPIYRVSQWNEETFIYVDEFTQFAFYTNQIHVGFLYSIENIIEQKDQLKLITIYDENEEFLDSYIDLSKSTVFGVNANDDNTLKQIDSVQTLSVPSVFSYMNQQWFLSKNNNIILSFVNKVNEIFMCKDFLICSAIIKNRKNYFLWNYENNLLQRFNQNFCPITMEENPFIKQNINTLNIQAFTSMKIIAHKIISNFSNLYLDFDNNKIMVFESIETPLNSTIIPQDLQKFYPFVSCIQSDLSISVDFPQLNLLIIEPSIENTNNLSSLLNYSNNKVTFFLVEIQTGNINNQNFASIFFPDSNTTLMINNDVLVLNVNNQIFLLKGSEISKLNLITTSDAKSITNFSLNNISLSFFQNGILTIENCLIDWSQQQLTQNINIASGETQINIFKFLTNTIQVNENYSKQFFLSSDLLSSLTLNVNYENFKRINYSLSSPSIGTLSTFLLNNDESILNPKNVSQTNISMQIVNFPIIDNINWGNSSMTIFNSCILINLDNQLTLYVDLNTNILFLMKNDQIWIQENNITTFLQIQETLLDNKVLISLDSINLDQYKISLIDGKLDFSNNYGTWTFWLEANNVFLLFKEPMNLLSNYINTPMAEYFNIEHLSNLQFYLKPMLSNGDNFVELMQNIISNTFVNINNMNFYKTILGNFIEIIENNYTLFVSKNLIIYEDTNIFIIDNKITSLQGNTQTSSTVLIPYISDTQFLSTGIQFKNILLQPMGNMFNIITALGNIIINLDIFIIQKNIEIFSSILYKENNKYNHMMMKSNFTEITLKSSQTFSSFLNEGDNTVVLAQGSLRMFISKYNNFNAFQYTGDKIKIIFDVNNLYVIHIDENGLETIVSDITTIPDCNVISNGTENGFEYNRNVFLHFTRNNNIVNFAIISQFNLTVDFNNNIIYYNDFALNSICNATIQNKTPLATSELAQSLSYIYTGNIIPMQTFSFNQSQLSNNLDISIFQDGYTECPDFTFYKGIINFVKIIYNNKTYFISKDTLVVTAPNYNKIYFQGQIYDYKHTNYNQDILTNGILILENVISDNNTIKFGDLSFIDNDNEINIIYDNVLSFNDTVINCAPFKNSYINPSTNNFFFNDSLSNISLDVQTGDIRTIIDNFNKTITIGNESINIYVHKYIKTLWFIMIQDNEKQIKINANGIYILTNDTTNSYFYETIWSKQVMFKKTILNTMIVDNLASVNLDNLLITNNGLIVNYTNNTVISMLFNEQTLSPLYINNITLIINIGDNTLNNLILNNYILSITQTALPILLNNKINNVYYNKRDLLNNLGVIVSDNGTFTLDLIDEYIEYNGNYQYNYEYIDYNSNTFDNTTNEIFRLYKKNNKHFFRYISGNKTTFYNIDTIVELETISETSTVLSIYLINTNNNQISISLYQFNNNTANTILNVLSIPNVVSNFKDQITLYIDQLAVYFNLKTIEFGFKVQSTFVTTDANNNILLTDSLVATVNKVIPSMIFPNLKFTDVFDSNMNIKYTQTTGDNETFYMFFANQENFRIIYSHSNHTIIIGNDTLILQDEVGLFTMDKLGALNEIVYIDNTLQTVSGLDDLYNKNIQNVNGNSLKVLTSGFIYNTPMETYEINRTQSFIKLYIHTQTKREMLFIDLIGQTINTNSSETVAKYLSSSASNPLSNPIIDSIEVFSYGDQMIDIKFMDFYKFEFIQNIDNQYDLYIPDNVNGKKTVYTLTVNGGYFLIIALYQDSVSNNFVEIQVFSSAELIEKLFLYEKSGCVYVTYKNQIIDTILYLDPNKSISRGSPTFMTNSQVFDEDLNFDGMGNYIINLQNSSYALQFFNHRGLSMKLCEQFNGEFSMLSNKISTLFFDDLSDSTRSVLNPNKDFLNIQNNISIDLPLNNTVAQCIYYANANENHNVLIGINPMYVAPAELYYFYTWENSYIWIVEQNKVVLFGFSIGTTNRVFQFKSLQIFELTDNLLNPVLLSSSDMTNDLDAEFSINSVKQCSVALKNFPIIMNIKNQYINFVADGIYREITSNLSTNTINITYNFVFNQYGLLQDLKLIFIQNALDLSSFLITSVIQISYENSLFVFEPLTDNFFPTNIVNVSFNTNMPKAISLTTSSLINFSGWFFTAEGTETSANEDILQIEISFNITNGIISGNLILNPNDDNEKINIYFSRDNLNTNYLYAINYQQKMNKSSILFIQNDVSSAAYTIDYFNKLTEIDDTSLYDTSYNFIVYESSIPNIIDPGIIIGAHNNQQVFWIQVSNTRTIIISIDHSTQQVSFSNATTN